MCPYMFPYMRPYMYAGNVDGAVLVTAWSQQNLFSCSSQETPETVTGSDAGARGGLCSGDEGVGGLWGSWEGGSRRGG